MNMRERLKNLVWAVVGGVVMSGAMMTYERVSNAGGYEAHIIGYVWGNDMKAASYAPSTSYSFNQTGAANAVQRDGVGSYAIKFSNLKQAGGNAQVTAYGPGAEFCKIANWQPSGGDEVVRIRCYGPGGQPADTMFSVTLMN